MSIWGPPLRCRYSDGMHDIRYRYRYPIDREGTSFDFEGADKYQDAVDRWISDQVGDTIQPGSGRFGYACSCYSEYTGEDELVVFWRDATGAEQEPWHPYGGYIGEVLEDLIVITNGGIKCLGGCRRWSLPDARCPHCAKPSSPTGRSPHRWAAFPPAPNGSCSATCAKKAAPGVPPRGPRPLPNPGHVPLAGRDGPRVFVTEAGALAESPTLGFRS